MFSKKCLRAVNRALKLMEEECPVYNDNPALTSPHESKEYWRLKLGNRKNEQFDILFLNNQNKPIAHETLFKGTVDCASVYPRVIIQKILEHNAASVILGHNHPSGNTDPSIQDKHVTKKIIEACKTIDVSVLDHIIVGEGTLSFAEHGLMN